MCISGKNCQCLLQTQGSHSSMCMNPDGLMLSVLKGLIVTYNNNHNLYLRYPKWILQIKCCGCLTNWKYIFLTLNKVHLLPLFCRHKIKFKQIIITKNVLLVGELVNSLVIIFNLLLRLQRWIFSCGLHIWCVFSHKKQLINKELGKKIETALF